MERIKQALEKARQERLSQEAVVTLAQTAAAPTAQEVSYSRTKTITVPKGVLEKNRIIAGVDNRQFTDAFKMLRTQVLQRLNENNWNVLAVTSPEIEVPADDGPESFFVIGE